MAAGFLNKFFRIAGTGALLALAACSGDLNPVRDLAVATGVGAEPKPAPDFIAKSRPAEVDYIEPGLAERPSKAKSAAEVKAAEAEMDQIRAKNEAEAAAARQLGAPPPAAAPAARANP